MLAKRTIGAIPTPDADQDPNPMRLMPANAVLSLFGGITWPTLRRWLNDPQLDFPRPVYIGSRRFWREAELYAWIEARPDHSEDPDQAHGVAAE